MDQKGNGPPAGLAPRARYGFAVEAIRTQMGLTPAAGAVLSLLVMRSYRLDDTAHRSIVQALEARQRDQPDGGSSARAPAPSRPG